jgi:hypothetical protein
MAEDYQNYDEHDEYYEYPKKTPYYLRDKEVHGAREALLEFILQNKDSVFYMKQLEVMFEKKFFHWITANAINELIGGELMMAEEMLAENTRIKFVFHKGLRYYKRQIEKTIDIVRKYSTPKIARAAGRQAEVLFFNALTNRGFRSHGQDISEYKGKKWTKTGNNLDFILEGDSIVYGCEVKNTLDYIDKEELMIKLDMCNHLRIKPLFIMRFAPKTYNYEIIQRGGFALLYEAQIFPFGYDELVNEIKTVLKLPVACPRAIPDGIIQRFLKWHQKQ